VGDGLSTDLRRGNNGWNDVHDGSYRRPSGLRWRSIRGVEPLSRSSFRNGQPLLRDIPRLPLRVCRWTVYQPSAMDSAIASDAKFAGSEFGAFDPRPDLAEGYLAGSRDIIGKRGKAAIVGSS